MTTRPIGTEQGGVLDRIEPDRPAPARGMRLVTAVLVMATSGCLNEAPQGRLLRAGECEYSDQKRYRVENSATGFASAGTLRVINDETNVPLKKGEAFGIQWEATGMPDVATITFVVQHPLIRRDDGTTHMGTRETLLKKSIDGRIESTDCYALIEDYELEPGNWTISIMRGHQVIATQTFKVGS